MARRAGSPGGRSSPTSSISPRSAADPVIERGVAGLSPEADRASRVPVGHAEGYFGAFGNIYADLAEVLKARREGRAAEASALWFPTAEEGLRSVATVDATARSAAGKGTWTDAVPPLLR